LHEWKDNPRNIKEGDFTRLKGQIARLGQYKPLLITPDGTVIGGNMRLRAYRELGVTDIWVSIIEPKDKNQMLEYALSDNDRAGYYDDDMLANLIPNYQIDWSQYAVDMKPPEDIQKLIDRIAPVEEDEAPEVSEGEAISKLGEVYQLGRHRLMCGDSTEIEDVEKLMDGQKADMVFTDPPYGMFLDTDWSDAKSSLTFMKDKGVTGGQKHREVIGDHEDFDPSHIFTYFDYCKEMFLWGANYYAERLQKKNDGSWFCWDKRLEESMDKMYGSCFELVWSKNKHKQDMVRVKWAGIFGREKEKDKQTLHPTRKPVELSTWFYKKFSEENDIVVDLYGGSGSFLLGAEQTNRICYMMELDPKYCDVIRKRYYKFIGKEEEWQTL
jgi:DNA modification methylase